MLWSFAGLLHNSAKLLRARLLRRLPRILPVARRKDTAQHRLHVSARLSVQVMLLREAHPLLRFHRSGQPQQVAVARPIRSTKPFARIHLPVSPQAKIHDHNFQKLSVEPAVACCQVLQRGMAAANNDAAGKKFIDEAEERRPKGRAQCQCPPLGNCPCDQYACDSVTTLPLP